jgi:hypothetical protein
LALQKRTWPAWREQAGSSCCFDVTGSHPSVHRHKWHR